MKEINIARVLTAKRKEKGITQDELASYIGVSKASVSKWETAQSYPDITFLPQLAAYFNISIDDLMGYEPQMTKEDIKTLYHRLASDFASSPFDAVMVDIDRMVKKYFSCFPLLYQMGILILNHHMLADTPEKATGALAQAQTLFARVKAESDDVELATQGLHMEALCLLAQNQPNEALDLLDGTETNFSSVETLFASAYQMLGQTEKAAASLQVGIYKQAISLIDLLCQYMGLFMADMPRFDAIYRRARSVVAAFDLETLHPSPVLNLYLTAACGYAASGQKEAAIEGFAAYVGLASSGIFPLRLHADDFFDKIGGWLEDLDPVPPRDEAVIKKSIVDAAENPMLAPIADDSRFVQLAGKLKNIMQEI